MILQSNKISIIDWASILMNNLIYEKSNKVKEIISTQHLILIPICNNAHWFIYFIIRSSEKLFMLILMDSLNTCIHVHFTNTIFNWFKYSIDAKQNQITLTLEIINLLDAVRQTDDHSCANFVCLYFYVASILSIKYLTEDEWLSSFNYKYIYINTNRTIMDF